MTTLDELTELTDIEEIVAQLKEADDIYFNDADSPLTDREYDALKRKAFLMNPANNYFVQVGSDVRGGKIKLPYVMGSLNQVYEGEIGAWVRKYGLGNCNVISSDKLDGISCMLVYNNGKLSIAYSRGNGVEGADITRHVKNIPDVPATVDYDYLVVRAEVIMSNSTFDKYYASTYKNARNMVGGAMNRKETDVDVLKNLSVVAYEIVAGDDSLIGLTKAESFKILSDQKFNTVTHFNVLGNDLNDALLTKALAEAKAASPYELDGLVLTIDDYANIDAQSDSSSLNPEHSVKYKVLDASGIVTTNVVDVLWELSKSGYWKPRVKILPVELYGTTVTYATGFNAKFINDNGIGRGAVISITKGGTVIPFIVNVLTKTIPIMPPDSHGGWKFNESGVEAVLIDIDAEPVVFKQVLDFFEKFKIEQLKEANLQKVWKTLSDKTYEGAITEICAMTEFEWRSVIGTNGSLICNSLSNRMGNAKPETFFGACKYMGVGFGVRKAKVLLEGIVDIHSDVDAITVDDIIAKDGFDIKTASSIFVGIPATLALMTKLCDIGVLNFVQSFTTDDTMAGLNVVMTGFRDAVLQEEIEAGGGKVSSGVSKKTTHLLCMDTSSDSGKMKKARDLGVIVMTPDEFKATYGL